MDQTAIINPLRFFKAFLFSAGLALFCSCMGDNIADMMEAEANYIDPQQNHTVYFKISATGQTNDYGITGSDGYYNNSNLPSQSFTDNANGTITDNITGLVWTKCSMKSGFQIDISSDCSETHGKYQWSSAMAACQELELAGRSNWRLPTIAELFSIVNFAKPGPGGPAPAIDDTFFPNTEYHSYYEMGGYSTMYTIISWLAALDKGYWTSTKWSVDDYAFHINFDDGTIFAEELTLSYFVRCVSGGNK